MAATWAEERGCVITPIDGKGKGKGGKGGGKGGKGAAQPSQYGQRFDPKSRACKFEVAKSGSCEKGKARDLNHDNKIVDATRKAQKDAKPKAKAKAKVKATTALAGAVVAEVLSEGANAAETPDTLRCWRSVRRV